MPEIIVASVKAGHPAGQRNRGGFRFTESPSCAEVSAEQRKIIKSDPYIIIHRRLSLAWFTAMGIEHTEKNEEKYKTEDPKDWKKKANLAPLSGAPVPDSQPAGKTANSAEESQDKASDSGGKKEAKINATSKKEEVIAALKAKGKIEGKDFDPQASRNALLGVLKEA